MSTSSISSVSSAAAANASTTQSATSAATMQDTFLKLLVAQMNNQDPMNPMDNSQITSQMAQISTVSGIQTMGQNLTSMTSQLASLQAIQGASLVGHQITASGNSLVMNAGKGAGAFTLATDADKVTVTVSDASSGQVLDSLNLGAVAAGQQAFNWTPPAGSSVTGPVNFTVTASQGSSAVTATPMVVGTVSAVSTANGALQLLLPGQVSVAYSNVQSIQ